MNKLLKELLEVKTFSVYVCDEFERRTNFLGLMSLLYRFSDFESFTSKEQLMYIKTGLKLKYFVIDWNITVSFK